MTITRRIGLLVGGDLCWPIFFEDIVRRLDPVVRMDGRTIRYEIERVADEPFDLSRPPRYDLVLDRLTPLDQSDCEWLQRAAVQDGTRLINNPFMAPAIDRHTAVAALLRLGIPVPETWHVPGRADDMADDHDDEVDLAIDVGSIGDRLGYPLYLKPSAPGIGSFRVDDADALRSAHDGWSARPALLQKAVEPHDLCVRVVGVGPQVDVIRYDRSLPPWDRYRVDFHFVDGEEWSFLTDLALALNSFFGCEFGRLEAVRQDGDFVVVNATNPNPDSRITSLHYHLPWLVKALIRWSLFRAAAGRSTVPDLEWERYLEIADAELPTRDRLRLYAELGRHRFEADRFEEFARTQLSGLDEVALDYFSEPAVREIIRWKVASAHPAGDVDHLVDHVHGLIRFWTHTERDRLDVVR